MNIISISVIYNDNIYNNRAENGEDLSFTWSWSQFTLL